MPAPKGTRPPSAGRGRKVGEKNKITADVKAMVRAALEQAGGVGYLVKQADKNPRAFMSLVGRLMPLEVTGVDGKDLIPAEMDRSKLALVLLGVIGGGENREGSPLAQETDAARSRRSRQVRIAAPRATARAHTAFSKDDRMNLRTIRRGALGLALVLLPALAWAAGNTPAFQSGNMIQGHDVAKIVRNGQFQDGGGITGDGTGHGLNPFAITDNNGPGLCFDTALTTGQYHYVCFGHDGNNNAIWTVDGANYPLFGNAGGNLSGQNPTPVGDWLLSNAQNGTLARDGGAPPVVSVTGGDATGATDSTTAVQNCLNSASSSGIRTCYAGNGRYLLLGNLHIPANTFLSCGETFANQAETPANLNTIPALLLDSAHTISATGESAGLRGCVVLNRGITYPASDSSGYSAGTIAVSDAGQADFSVQDSVIVGFDTCIYNTGKRPYYRRDYLDCNGVTKAALELDVGNTDSGYVTDIKLQYIGTSGSNACAAVERPGTGLRVGGTAFSAPGIWLDRIVSIFFNTNYDFEGPTIAGALWSDGIDFQGAPYNCTTHSTGVLMGPGGGVYASFLNSNGTYVGIHDNSNGFLSYVGNLNVSTGTQANGASHCIVLGDGTNSGQMTFGTAALGPCGGMAVHVETATSLMSGHYVIMQLVNNNTAPYIDVATGGDVLLGNKGTGTVFFDQWAAPNLSATANPFQSFAQSGSGFSVARGSELMQRGIANFAPSVCTGAGSGATCALASGADPVAGTILITAGSSASAVGSLAFNRPFAADMTTTCTATPYANDWTITATAQISVTGSGVTVNWANGGTNLTNGVGYAINYHCYDS